MESNLRLTVAKLSEDEIKCQLQQMNPYEFEELVAELWELQGYEATVRSGSGDRGIDVEATRKTPFEQKILIQAKRYAEGNKVGSGDVRSYATLYQQVPNVDTVVIVTTSEFTKEAETLAGDLNVKILNKDDLADIITENISTIDYFEHPEPKTTSNTTKINETVKRLNSLSNNAPKFKKFEWPIDERGKGWINEQEYLFILMKGESFLTDSIALQYVKINGDFETISLKILVITQDEDGMGPEYEDVNKIEDVFDCEVKKQEIFPGIPIVKNIPADEHSITDDLEIIEYIMNNILNSDGGIDEVEMNSVEESGIYAVCTECGAGLGKNVSYCPKCGSSESESR